MKRANRSGLTLIELITGIAVLSVVSTIGMGVISGAMDGWSVAKINRNLDHNAQNVFDQMRGDFGRVAPSALTGVGLVGGELRSDDPDRTGATRMDSFFVLPVSNQQSQGADLMASVMYRLVREEGKPTILQRTMGPLGAKQPEGGALTLLAGSVPLGLRAEFQNAQGDWLKEWKEAGLPEAVRVSLTLRDENRPNEQIVRKSVFALHVK